MANSKAKKSGKKGRTGGANVTEYVNQLNGFSRSQAMIEFNLDGTIVNANDNFCNALGYRLEEIKGQHHSKFVDPVFAKSPEYRQFWADLATGKFQAGEFRRFKKDGSEIWILASYNPILDQSGKAYKVIKLASDITAQKVASLASQVRALEYTNQINSFSRSQAMIEFNLDGTIVNANDNFCNALGYRLEEIKGQHHSKFVDAAFAKTAEYRQFWTDLGSGKFQVGEFRRVKKDGSDLWILASYNPILDEHGKAYKVIKLASDITARKLAQIEQEKERDQAAKIEEILRKVASGADQIDQGSQQIASSSQSLSEGASEQAANLEQISASLEEVTSMTNQNAENARQAAGLSEEAAKSSKKGQSEMNAMSQAMDEIKKSSAEISKIIKVIDEIAFQTNLLALNAAVEAARAGEAGKGFAVVAEEVRNLAQRSAEAAKNTSSMIEESTKRADNGVSIAQRVRTSLEEIGTSTTKVNTLLAEIASASKEQAEGVTQVSKGVNELDKVTQQNAGNAEELAAAAQEAASQVAALREVVGGSSTTAASQAPVKSPGRAPAPPANAPKPGASKLGMQKSSPTGKRDVLAATSRRAAKDSAEAAIPMGADSDAALASF
jgi:methyl-accepting chemotaxis protein